jgi:DNA-binding response OmpR family regulator/anti-sigma regulatory factor (Ser/Thr protein kinase)
MESGQIVFHLGRVDMRPLLEQAIEAQREFAAGFHVRLRLDPGSGASDVRADPDRLTQVVTNLLSNAIKFSPAGEEVVVANEPRDGAIRLTVRDHGPGIPDDFKPRIFDKFAQADATDARQKSGTGLGLSIVKQIVVRLKGEVGFEDARGGGTIFHVDLPPWKPPADDEFSPRPAQSHNRLLICNDQPPAANLLAERLAKVGYTSDISATGVEAIERATAIRYAAILIDLQLPDCDGISLIQQLRAQPQNRDTQIVVVSADPDRGPDNIKSSILDVLDWIQKPVDIDRLARLLDRPVIRNTSRPRILHVSDPDELHVVSRALNAAADWVSVESIDAARRALAANRFDLAVIDIALAAGSGLDLLPDLRDTEGRAVPVIVLSAQGANPTCAAQVKAALTKSHASIDQLITTLRRRTESKGSTLIKKKETA